MSATLADLGHDTLSAVEKTPGVSDEALLTLAIRERRVLITLDKDFGELVFVRRLPHPCIIRFVGMKVCDMVAAMGDLIRQHAGSMQDGVLIVVTSNRVRVRRGLPPSKA